MIDQNESTVRAHLPYSSAHAAQSLRASDAIIEISADAIISIDAQQRIIRFNHGAEIIFGYRAAELLGRPLEILLPERFRGAHFTHLTRFGEGAVAARRMGERRQIAGLRANGEEFPAEASISRIDIAGERMYTVVLRDISQRQRAEQVQRFLAQAGELLAGSLEAERTLESLAQLAVPLLGDWCVIFAARLGGSVTRALAVHHDPERASEMQRLREIPFRMSPAHPAVAALNEARSSLLALDDAQLQAMADDDEHLQILRGLDPRSLIAVPMKARARVLGAICFFFEGRRHRAHSHDDLELAEELGRRAALALDNARLYAEATQAIRARDDVLAVVSHDLGNPLSAIRLSTSLLLRRPPADRAAQEERKQLENIRASVDQMERLIKDLLDVKRIEAGLLSLEREPCVVSVLMREIADTAERWIEGKTLRITLDSTNEPVHVYADPQRVVQVFSNLVGNAARFAPTGGEIVLRSRREGDQVRFSVADTGPGIPVEHLPHIFDRFWQASRTGRHGIGLGLAIVKGIVEAHGGRVWAESVLGAGSTFHFTLPLRDTTP